MFTSRNRRAASVCPSPTVGARAARIARSPGGRPPGGPQIKPAAERWATAPRGDSSYRCGPRAPIARGYVLGRRPSTRWYGPPASARRGFWPSRRETTVDANASANYLSSRPGQPLARRPTSRPAAPECERIGAALIAPPTSIRVASGRGRTDVRVESVRRAARRPRPDSRSPGRDGRIVFRPQERARAGETAARNSESSSQAAHLAHLQDVGETSAALEDVPLPPAPASPVRTAAPCLEPGTGTGCS